jgi:cytochrome b subunit of formate dehydrogenase
MQSMHALAKSEILERILDENNCPVARMRLFSQGIQTNNRILIYEPVTGDRGCLACGNCVDACPVVQDKQRFVFTQNQRTSMSLENIVGPECRRCYACVRTCPQVSKSAKEFVTGFRRGEKVVHAYTATLIFSLAASGIFMFHFKEILPGWQQLVFKLAHTFTGFLLFLAPLLYFYLDRSHMKRALRNVFRFGPEDLVWLKNFWIYLKSPGRRSLPSWNEFNTYHKIWFSYLLTVVPVLGLTGIINWVGEETAGPIVFGFSSWIHFLFALTMDLLILTHIYFKLFRHIFRNISDMRVSYQKSGSLHYPFLYDPKSDSRQSF